MMEFHAFSDSMAFHDQASATSDDLDSRSGSGLDGTFSSGTYPLDERSRLEQKLEKIREKMTQNSLAHERDLEEYLRITGGLEVKSDNPQMLRIKQHFEKKNKKYSQELSQLQKKLVDAEQRLDALERGGSLNTTTNSTGHNSMLHNVSHGIKKTGSNIKEMTENAIAVPFDIAYKMKKNMFGSADNLPKTVDDMGHSTFYVHPPAVTSSHSDRGRSSTLPQEMSGLADRLPESPLASLVPIVKVERPDYESRGYREQIKQLNKEIESLRARNSQLEKMLSDHRSETKAEILAYRNELSDARFKIQQLEQTLNETMEVHQNEVKQLKSDLNLIGTRMDYQYNDRFKRIEETIESANNRMYHMEMSLRENNERFAGGQGLWKALVLNGANILVELLKIVLYLIAFILDFLRNLFGTKNRAVILVISCLVVAILWDLFDISNKISNISNHFVLRFTTKDRST